jgi:thiosulfate dehydrogenase
VPPLWGEDSFNGGAGMGQIAYAASYIRATMPPGTDYQAPILSVQEAWDVAAFMIANPHPIAPPEIETVPLPAETPADSDQAAGSP